jgi:hypothetical protein
VTVSDRLESLTLRIIQQWNASNGCLGVRRSKLEMFGQPEKLYLICRALAKLRREQKLRLENRYYCLDHEYLASLKESFGVREIAA